VMWNPIPGTSYKQLIRRHSQSKFFHLFWTLWYSVQKFQRGVPIYYLGIDKAFMLMAPYHKVQKTWQEMLIYSTFRVCLYPVWIPV
jgi:hypothetical protein